MRWFLRYLVPRLFFMICFAVTVTALSCLPHALIRHLPELSPIPSSWFSWKVWMLILILCGWSSWGLYRAVDQRNDLKAVLYPAVVMVYIAIAFAIYTGVSAQTLKIPKPLIFVLPCFIVPIVLGVAIGKLITEAMTIDDERRRLLRKRPTL